MDSQALALYLGPVFLLVVLYGYYRVAKWVKDRVVARGYSGSSGWVLGAATILVGLFVLTGIVMGPVLHQAPKKAEYRDR